MTYIPAESRASCRGCACAPADEAPSKAQGIACSQRMSWRPPTIRHRYINILTILPEFASADSEKYSPISYNWAVVKRQLMLHFVASAQPAAQASGVPKLTMRYQFTMAYVFEAELA